MPRITEAVEDRIHELRIGEDSKPRSARKISAMLAAEGIQLSDVSVAKVLKARREERQEVVREVIRERVAPTVTVDVDVLGELAAVGMEVWRASRPLPEDAETAPPGHIKMAAKDWTSLGRELREVALARIKIASGEDADPAAGKDLAEALHGAMAEVYNLGKEEGRVEAEQAAQAIPAAASVVAPALPPALAQ